MLSSKMRLESDGPQRGAGGDCKADLGPTPTKESLDEALEEPLDAARQGALARRAPERQNANGWRHEGFAKEGLRPG